MPNWPPTISSVGPSLFGAHMGITDAMPLTATGATFGSDSNAQTTPTQTVYKLDLPSATEAGLDESLKILKGMMDKPAITKAALDRLRDRSQN